MTNNTCNIVAGYKSDDSIRLEKLKWHKLMKLIRFYRSYSCSHWKQARWNSREEIT